MILNDLKDNLRVLPIFSLKMFHLFIQTHILNFIINFILIKWISEATTNLKYKSFLDLESTSLSKNVPKHIAQLLFHFTRDCQLLSVWKKSFTTSVLKAGSKQNILNYRPITIMVSISKVSYSIIAEILTDKCIQFIIQNQHSSVDFYKEYIVNSPNKSLQVDSIYLDFLEGFDIINRSLLLFKLYNFGINGLSLNGLNLIFQILILTDHIKVPFTANIRIPKCSNLGICFSYYLLMI